MALTRECDSFPSYLNGNHSSIIINQMDRYYLSFSFTFILQRNLINMIQ